MFAWVLDMPLDFRCGVSSDIYEQSPVNLWNQNIFGKTTDHYILEDLLIIYRVLFNMWSFIYDVRKKRKNLDPPPPYPQPSNFSLTLTFLGVLNQPLPFPPGNDLSIQLFVSFSSLIHTIFMTITKLTGKQTDVAQANFHEKLYTSSTSIIELHINCKRSLMLEAV